MAYKRQALYDTLRTKAFGDITASYTTLGVPLTNEALIYTLINDTPTNLYFSTNGTTDSIYLPAFSATVKDIRANSAGDGLFLAAGTQLYVKHDGSAAISGLAAFEVIYANGR